ncbi:MAG: hypothetical protein KDA37_13840, partial [Planctomycetales bacterium]|nr:hypothetical protein [Planctomycetales bacterium]
MCGKNSSPIYLKRQTSFSLSSSRLARLLAATNYPHSPFRIPHSSMLLRTHTLGCKVNQYETEYVGEGLRSAGYRNAADGEPAQVCIVNTCTVTAEGDRKARQDIRRLARDNPEAPIIVTGCA